MKVLIITTSEQTGGAAIAANRIMKSLNKNGVEARLLVAKKETSCEDVIQVKPVRLFRISFLWERFVIWCTNLFSRKNLFKVSIANSGMRITELNEFKEADIIHLNWINQGMLSLREIKRIANSGKKIVWTLHDMWPLTGICHHAGTCNHYEKQCGECPLLRFPSKHDLSYRVWKKKTKTYTKDIRIVAVSSWLAGKAKQSSLLGQNSITVIPNTLSLESFRTLHQKKSRIWSGIPADKYIILFGAARVDEPAKGLIYLIDAIRYLIDQNIMEQDKLHLVLFGDWKGNLDIIEDLPLSGTYMGVVNQDILPEIYSAGDVLVSSSLYETFGQTIIEAQACGCIPVSFDNSGQTDIITHKENGYLAQYLSVTDLAEGIRWALKDAPGEISIEAMKETVKQRYSEEAVAKQYIELYNKLIK